MKSRDDLFTVNDKVLLSSKPSGVPNGAPPASVKGHISLLLVWVHILTPPIVACGGLPTVLAVLFTLEEIVYCLPSLFTLPPEAGGYLEAGQNSVPKEGSGEI
jgi:hypothetical protein